jgi:ABC-type sugar transport system substrate-binding protein
VAILHPSRGAPDGGILAEEKTVFVLLPGKKESGDYYQLLQESVALSRGSELGLRVEVAYAPAFDQLRVLKRRLAAGLDATVVEPASVQTMGFILRELREKTGLVLLNAWDASVEEAARGWGQHPFGTVSTDHGRIGRIQGEQVRALLPGRGLVLCITGPRRSSAAEERYEGLRAAVGSGIEILDAEAGDWTEPGGATAFGDWYRVFAARDAAVDAVAAQSDELAMGVRDAIRGLPAGPRIDAMRRAPLLGVDACPSYGRRLVDEGTLTASVETPANAGLALDLLQRFWTKAHRLPLRSLTTPRPYPR